MKSVAECETAFTEQPENTEYCQKVCRDLGNVLQGMGRFDEAVVWHSFALDNEPNLVDVYAQIGRLYAQEANWEKAVVVFNHALKLKPDAVHLYSNLAQIYGQMGQRLAEIECWYQALESDPEMVNANGYYKLGKAFEQFGKMDRALMCLQRACDRSDELFDAHYDLGEIWLRQGNLELAKARFQKILEQDPQQAKAHYKMGNIAFRQRQYDTAIEQFRQTIKVAPEFPWAYRDLVKTFLHLRKWDEAISTCHAIINLVEEFPWVYIQLGDALREKGRINDAVTNFKKACKLRGWKECRDRDYYFTKDTFSYRLAIWQPIFKPIMQQKSLKIIELGSYQGMSACWFLDTVLTHDSAQLVCIDSQFESDFTGNLNSTGAQEKVTLLTGTVAQHLPNLELNSFDVANLQDKRKSVDAAFENADAVWKLLKVGGLAIFNDYGWLNSQAPELNPKEGIDRFLTSIKDRWELVTRSPQSFQFIIKKIA
ncbi:TPR domain protein [Hyella patelloides LEGE 07179]|uniref:TPR domain protein n=1 Tax=Hyella patelloides LEGE 07179 TaxID=945734 RepID=A0A563VT02_9CYAN|nr:tetratricopeptide repeat protein [Hyella patelloides]VEP14567.1 TPR domain protein [Hyella patelloides LEGE 07179]